MKRNSFVILTCLLAVSTLYFGIQLGLSAPATKQNSTAPSPTATRRPVVVYFYANWCGVCQRYGPVLRNTVAPFGNSIDYRSVNVDDASNRRATQRFNIHSIPATYIYNSKGESVFSQVGYIDQRTLYSVLRRVYMESTAKPTKIDVNKHNKKATISTKRKTSKSP